MASLFKREAPLPSPRYAAPQLLEPQPTRVTMTINGREVVVPNTWTVLRACREHGFNVPTLCHHPMLTPTGRCGVCVVSVTTSSSSSSSPGGAASFAVAERTQIVPSCKTRVKQGMVVRTDTPEVLHTAESNLRQFLGGRAPEAFGPGSLEIEDVVRLVGARERATGRESGRQWPIVRDQSKCISCTRCVRACNDLQGLGVLAIDPEQPAAPIVFAGNLPLQLTACIGCGQCALVCPTGAVSERCDIDVVLDELKKPEGQRKIVMVMTAPSARLSLGETQGDQPGTTDPGKCVAALHAAGFDLVFDTTFAADTCAVLEATELLQRVRAKGPFPMFTSCCPGWVTFATKCAPHLLPNISRCRSPMMMLGAMVRDWMARRGDGSFDRSSYMLVALMPCTAKKAEIERPELFGPDGKPDVDVVLTVREMGKLLKKRHVHWRKLPGTHSADYDPPFNESSGGGALFGVSGGVMEAAMRVAHTVLSKQDITQRNANIFDACRNAATKLTGEWLSEALDVTPETRHKRQLSVAIVSGIRSLQAFLKENGIAEDGGSASGGKSSKSSLPHFVEVMACPQGCISGGGQPVSLDPKIYERRRTAIYNVDAKAHHASSLSAQSEFIRATFNGITSETARRLLEYEMPTRPQSPSAFLQPHPVSTPRAGSVTSGMSSSLSGIVGDVLVLYGSQGGSTISYARRLSSHLRSELGCSVSTISMDQFSIEKLPSVQTLIVMTSTWESDSGLAPHNAEKFFADLCATQPEKLRSLLVATAFAVCGFGSSKYEHFCGFGEQMFSVLLSLGAYPLLSLTKVDVDSADKGRERYTAWQKQLTHSLMHTGLPSPRYLVVPAIAPSGFKHVTAVAPGYRLGTVVQVRQYKESQTPNSGKYFLVELSTGKTPIRVNPGESIEILPCNPRSETEALVNSLYPGMLGQATSLVPISTAGFAASHGSELPAHLTIRQLFEQFLALSAKPARNFVARLEQLAAVQEAKLSEILATPEAFAKFSETATYYSVLQLYKSVVPPLEILVSMLPLMEPRPYTPMEVEEPHIGRLSFSFRLVQNGLCTRYLAGLKKGDTVQFRIATSLFSRPIDPFLNPRVHVPVPRQDVSLEWTDSSGSLLDIGSPSTLASSPTQVSPYHATKRPPLPPKGLELSGRLHLRESGNLLPSPLGTPQILAAQDAFVDSRSSSISYSEEPYERQIPRCEVVLRQWLQRRKLAKYSEGLIGAGCNSLAGLVEGRAAEYVAQHKRLHKALPEARHAVLMLRYPWKQLVALNSKTRRPSKISSVRLPADT